MTHYRKHVAAFLAMNLGLLFSAGAQAGNWQSNAPFGATLNGDLYTPTTPAASPAILVVIHMCTGKSTTVRSWFSSFADQYGFYLIAPDAGKQCFESSATRGGDRAAIVKMVDWVVTNKSANRDRVFAAGMSSGGCMTNTLLAIYPDVFKGGAAMPGFPAGAWPAGDTQCSKCGSEPASTDGKYWGDIARNAFKWSGTYPCSQQWVGGADDYNFDGYLPAVAAQWRNLAGLGAGEAGTGAPSGWQRTVYKDTAGNVRLETNVLPGQKHDLGPKGNDMYGNIVKFLGLDKQTGACGVETSGTGGSGGAGAGGATGMSGGSSSGGAGGAVTGSGGAPVTGSGGSTTTTGGASTASGGSPVTSGGATATGSGGASSGGSTPASKGGTTSTSGGAVATSGGATVVAGTTSSGGAEPDASGCSCMVVGHSAEKPLTGLLTLAGLGALLARRRRRRD